MKLLGWMHRKFRQNGCEPINDFVLGQTMQDDHRRLSCDSRQLRESEIDHLLRKSFSGIDSMKIEFCGNSDGDEGQLPADMAGLFHGFLAIGTLGSSEPSMVAEETPTFELSVTEEIPIIEFLVEDGTPMFELSVEDIVAEKETEITENELNLINEELEKALLGPGAEDDVSPGRNSHVSTGRSSHASGGAGATTVCPLQGYLLGSAVDVLGCKDGTDAVKKEQRTTLGELFQMTDEGTKEDFAKKGGEDADASSVVKFVKKKMMKKKSVHAVSASKGSSTGVPDPATSSENKLHKILQMFQKKVHPEDETARYKSHGKHKKVKFASEIMTKSRDKVDGGGRRISGPMTGGEDMNKLTENLLQKEKIRRMKPQANVLTLPTITADGDESNGNRECWIKTDDEYLVLEL